MHDVTIATETNARGTLIRAAGELGMNDVRRLNDAFYPVIAQHPKLVVLDLSGVTMIGSLGMGAILTAKRAVERNGGKLFVAAARPMVLDAFARARLTEVLNVRGTVDAAFADGAG